jgi:CheY-like chemotaxis protein
MFRDLFELVSDGIGIIRAERFIYANTALAELLGHTQPEALQAETLGTYLPEFAAEEFRKAAKIALDRHEASLHPELTWQSRVGQPLTRLTYVLPVLFDGRPALLVFLRNPSSAVSREFESGTHCSGRPPSSPPESRPRTDDVLSRLVIAKPELDLLCRALSTASVSDLEWQEPQPREIPVSEQPKPEPKQARILVIDDEPLLGQTLSYAFAGRYDVVVTMGGREALDMLAKDTNFDLILCDLTMPQVSGAMVYEAVERDYPQLVPHFVFMTGGIFTDASSRFMSRYRGLQLEKPFNIDDIDQLLTEIG